MQQQQQHQPPSHTQGRAPAPAAWPSRRQRTTFEPPDRVVPVAFNELLSRLARARSLRPADSTLAEEEKVIFTYGVSQRRRVLEHTVLLIFGQWLAYKQVVSKFTSSRPLRSIYAFGAFASTSAFLRMRAMAVSNDLFAHIATMGPENSLANEARIVLAELEGPAGPYFKQICEKNGNGLQQLLPMDAAFEDAGGSLEGQGEGEGQSEGEMHPQLNLEPRLLSNELLEQSMTRHPQISQRAAPSSSSSSSSSSGNAYGINARTATDKQSPSPIRLRSKTRTRTNDESNSPSAIDISVSSPSPFELEKRENNSSKNDNLSSPSLPRSASAEATRGYQTSSDGGAWHGSGKSNNYTDELEQDGQVEWGQAFDFSKSAGHFDNGDPVNEWDEVGETRENASLTPSQRRAAERKRQRMSGRARSTQTHPHDRSNLDHS